METFNIEHYTVVVETDQMCKPGNTINVTIKSNRPNARYASVYSLIFFPGDTPQDLAKRAFIHYTQGTRPNDRVMLRGIKDGTGCERYTMSEKSLNDLYRRFENFVADCTQEEYQANKSSIIAIYTLLKKHIDAAIYQ